MRLILPHRKRVILWRSVVVGLAGLLVSSIALYYYAENARVSETFVYNFLLGPYLLLLGCLEVRRILEVRDAKL
jgi:hypothetical protein